MLARILVENFKSLRSVNIELKPLTIFIGPNGAGKSSILQSILMLKKLYNVQGNTALEGLFQLNGYVNMGTWNDVTFNSNKPIKIGTEINNKRVQMLLNVTLFKEKKATIDIRLRIKENAINLAKTISLPYSQRQPQNVAIKVENGILSGNWDCFNINITSTRGKIPEDIKSAIISQLNAWHRKVFFVPSAISTFRQPQASIQTPQREIVANNIKRSLVVNESLLITLMAIDSDIEDYVMRCVEEIYEIRVRSHTFPQNIARIIASIRRGKTTPIVNEGGGINRSVYMFIVLAFAEEGSTIMIEEPETNLHPKAQYRLAKVFAEAVSNEEKQLVITTHSEHLLFGILNEIEKKKIKLEDIVIYYVQKNKRGETVPKQLEIDEHGRVKGGLPGFFEEEIEELIEALNK